jgi:hypothetical protein
MIDTGVFSRKRGGGPVFLPVVMWKERAPNAKNKDKGTGREADTGALQAGNVISLRKDR